MIAPSFEFYPHFRMKYAPMKYEYVSKIPFRFTRRQRYYETGMDLRECAPQTNPMLQLRAYAQSNCAHRICCKTPLHPKYARSNCAHQICCKTPQVFRLDLRLL